MAQRALTELLRGNGADADPSACVEDISAELAARRVAGFPHSIAQLVFHMNYWMDYELRRIRGQSPKYPQHNAESFPAGEAPLEAPEWDRLQIQFSELLGEFLALAKVSREELDRPIETVHQGDTKVAGSLQAVVMQMIAHNSYHTGQIALLRRVMGSLPPRRGGGSGEK